MPLHRITPTVVLLFSLAMLGPALSAIATGSSISGNSVDADTDSAEIKTLILDHHTESNRRNELAPVALSSEGSVEFWSSGGLRQHVKEGHVHALASHNITPKDIEVISLVPGQAAVATFYAEGSLQAKGADTVTDYMTRVTHVYVKEDGQWKRRSAHWSPIKGGAGATPTVLEKKS